MPRWQQEGLHCVAQGISAMERSGGELDTKPLRRGNEGKANEACPVESSFLPNDGPPSRGLTRPVRKYTLILQL